ncbi:MAG: helix-turn-helix transcriptional regulator [Acidimicrobiia bacterium]
MLETSARLLRLLSMLQTSRDWRADELAEQLGVTTRTVRNDISRLRKLGYRIDSMKGPGGGYWLAPGNSIPPLLLDDDEAVAIMIALRTASSGTVRGVEDAGARAVAKLQQMLPARVQERVAALQGMVETVPAKGPGVDMDLLLLISTASRRRQQLRFDYRRHGGRSDQRRAEPHRLVSDGGRWYLLGWDIERNDWRTYRVDRIDNARIWPGAKFPIRRVDDAAARVASGVATAMWNYRAAVVTDAPAEALLERLPSAVQVEIIDENTCRLHVGSSSPEMLARYLSLIGVDVTVEDPDTHPELLRELRHLSERLLRAAGSGGEPK